MTGPLIIGNSSMTTLSVFAHLTSISSSGAMTNVGSREFDHFWALVFVFADVLMLCPDNAQLVDLFQVLNTQASAAGGTLVANNAVLCFSASVSWSRRNDSYLEYNLASV